jgi:Uncharacterized protein conserved in bacteria (DUF2147)
MTTHRLAGPAAQRVNWLAALTAQIFMLLALPASAGTLDGRWQIPGEKPGEVSAVVRLEPAAPAGQGAEPLYRGVVEKLILAPGDDPEPKCNKCAGAKKDQPVKGLEVLWGLRRGAQAKSGAVTYQDGTALDPGEGGTYRCKMVLSADGKSLTVTYYVGVAFLGQTEVWTRAESN